MRKLKITKGYVAVAVGIMLAFCAGTSFSAATKHEGDPLAFVGALLGGAAAVAGGVIVVQIQERDQRANAIANLRQIMTALDLAVIELTSEFLFVPNDAAPFNFRRPKLSAAFDAVEFYGSELGDRDLARAAGYPESIRKVRSELEKARIYLPNVAGGMNLPDFFMPQMQTMVRNLERDLSPLRVAIRDAMAEISL